MDKIALDFVPALLVILVAAGLGRMLSKGMRQPAILGELILGMILGNIIILSSTGTFAAEGPISSIAHIGILLLLFSVGLSLNFEEFKRLEVASSVVAVFGVVLPFVLGYLAAILFDFSHTVALFVGTGLVATSVGVKASILTDLKMLHTRLGTLIMGAAVIDNVIGVVMVSALIGSLTLGAIVVGEIALLIILTILFFLISLAFLIKLGRRLSEKITLGREDLLLLGLVIVLVFGLISEEIGLSAIVGAFIAGVIAGHTHFVRRLREYVSLIGGGFFIPIFFVTVGMGFNIHEFAHVGTFAVVVIIVAIVGKIVGCGLGARASKFSGKESFAVGVAMIPRAGVELILIKLGLEGGLITPDIASALMMMVIVTTLITPPLLLKTLKMAKIKK
jgi:Kef-type K+ transport system membrane component KefB